MTKKSFKSILLATYLCNVSFPPAVSQMRLLFPIMIPLWSWYKLIPGLWTRLLTIMLSSILQREVMCTWCQGKPPARRLLWEGVWSCRSTLRLTQNFSSGAGNTQIPWRTLNPPYSRAKWSLETTGTCSFSSILAMACFQESFPWDRQAPFYRKLSGFKEGNCSAFLSSLSSIISKPQYDQIKKDTTLL